MRGQVTVAVALVAIVTTACTGGGSSASAGAGAGGQSAAPTGAPGAAPPGVAKAAPTTATSTDRSIVRTAELTVRVKDIAAQAQKAREIATAARGLVATDDRAGDGATASADLTLKVPTASTDRVLDQLAGLGQAGNRHLSSMDVSQTVADVDSRVSSMRAAIARLRGLYDRAATVSEILAVEAQLSQREANLEALEAQQRALADQTALAAITVHVRPIVVPPKPKGRTTGVVHGLQGGWSAFVATVSWLLTAISAALPFLAVAALLAAAAVYLRRVRRRTTPPQPGAPADPA